MSESVQLTRQWKILRLLVAETAVNDKTIRRDLKVLQREFDTTATGGDSAKRFRIRRKSQKTVLGHSTEEQRVSSGEGVLFKRQSQPQVDVRQYRPHRGAPKPVRLSGQVRVRFSSNKGENTMDDSTYTKLANASKFDADNLHDAYLEIQTANPNRLASRARLRAIDEYRRTSRVIQWTESIHAARCDHPGPIEIAAGSETRESVREAVRTLPAVLRETVELRWFSGLSLDQIATAMGCCLNTVNTWLRRAHIRLKTNSKLQQIACDQCLETDTP